MRETWARRVAMALLASAALVPLACGRVLGLGDPQLAPDDGLPAPTNDPASPDPPDPGGPPEGLDAALPPLGTPDASCGNTTSDGKNCGACGRDCLGGQCYSGRCEPVVLAAQQGQAEAIAVSDTEVFWSAVVNVDGNDHGIIRACPLAGCGAAPPRKVFDVPNFRPVNLSLTPQSVYFSLRGRDRVLSCPLSGCTGAPRVVGEQLVNGEFSVSTTQLAYLARPESSDGPVRVLRCPLAGCPSSLPLYTAPLLALPVAVAAEPSAVSVTVSGDGVQVVRCPTPSATTSDCLSGRVLWSARGSSVGNMLATPTALFFSAHDADASAQTSLYGCSLPDCTGGPNVLVEQFPAGGDRLGVNARHVYWASQEYSAVFRAGIKGRVKTGELLLTMQGRPRNIVVRDGVVYFTRSEFADVVRYVPPP